MSDARRFWLRPLLLEDLAIVAAWYTSVEDLALFHRRMPVPLSADALEAQWREMLVQPEPRDSYWFAIDDDDRRLVGLGGIEDISYAHGDAITPLFIAPEARRLGVGLRVRALLLDLAFDQLRLARVTSIHRADNPGSARLNVECGLREEGRLREAWFAGGERVDLLVYGILAEEWRAHRITLRESVGPETVVTLGRPGSAWSWPRDELDHDA